MLLRDRVEKKRFSINFGLRSIFLRKLMLLDSQIKISIKLMTPSVNQLKRFPSKNNQKKLSATEINQNAFSNKNILPQ